MPLYTVGRSAFTLSTSADSLIIYSSGKPLRIWYADFKGLGVSSSANEVVMYRLTTVGSTAVTGAITPSKANTASAAPTFTVYTGFGSSTSTTAGEAMWRFVPNGNGGIDRFQALGVDKYLSVPSSGIVGMKAATGAGSVTANMIIEEVDG